MKEYLMIIAAVVLLALGFAVQKLYQKITGSSTESGVEFSIVSGLCSIVLLLITNGFSLSFTPFSFACALTGTLAALLYTILGFKIMKDGQVAVYMLFLMSGGMLVPTVFGWVFLKEKPEVLPVLGVIVILVSIILNAVGGEKPSARVLIMCFGVFFLNGVVSVASKVHQVNTLYASVPTVDYAMLSSMASVGASILLRAALAVKSKAAPGKREKHGFLPILLVAVYSVLGTFSSVLQLEGAKSVPASVLYPMITGGTIALTGLFAFLFFKERLSKWGIASIVLCCVGTCLFI